MSNVPYLPNLDPIIQAGIDPKTGLPIKFGNPVTLKEDIKRLISVVDRQDAITRFKWDNLPDGLTGEIIERVLYYKGQGILFKMSDDRFYFLPYSLAGSIDVYGRFMQVTPLPFAGGKEDTNKPWVTGLIKKPVYDLNLDDIDPDDACVIIRDYAPGIEQTILPRSIINSPVIDVESDCIPFLRTALLNSTGVQGVRVQDETAGSNVLNASRAIDNAALCGQKYIPIVGGMDFQEMTGGSVTDAGEFLMCMQSLDNFRLQLLGIQNGGIFTKKEHVLQEEQDLNTGSDSIMMKDALNQRQEACEKINNIFGLDISVSINPEQSDYEEDDVDVLPDDGEV